MRLQLILNTERSFPNTRRPVSAQHVSRRRLQHVSWVLEPTQHYSIASALLPGREPGRSLNIHCVSAEAMSRKTRCENTNWNYFRKILRAHPEGFTCTPGRFYVHTRKVLRAHPEGFTCTPKPLRKWEKKWVSANSIRQLTRSTETSDEDAHRWTKAYKFLLIRA